MTRQVITSAGGQASASGGRFKLQVPQDALKQDVAITIQQIDAPTSGAVGPVYEVGPTGTLFQRKATLSFSFTNLSVSSDDIPNLHVATLVGGSWVPVTSTVDRVSGQVTGQISHLSPWTLIVYTKEVPPEPVASTDGGSGADAAQSDVGGAAGAAGLDGGPHDAPSGSAGSGGAGAAGAAGTSGGAGASGAAGTTGGAGTSGAAGTSGTAGTTGAAGTRARSARRARLVRRERRVRAARPVIQLARAVPPGDSDADAGADPDAT